MQLFGFSIRRPISTEMTYSAAAVANRFLMHAFEEKREVDPMKIQKLCYLAHGHYLAAYNQPLLNELFEAWKFGPVLPSLYRAAKHFRGGKIDELIKERDHETRRLREAMRPTDPSACEVIDFVWKHYSVIPSMRLSYWTHELGGPWQQTMAAGATQFVNQDIENDLIRDYFISRAENDAEAPAAPRAG